MLMLMNKCCLFTFEYLCHRLDMVITTRGQFHRTAWSRNPFEWHKGRRCDWRLCSIDDLLVPRLSM